MQPPSGEFYVPRDHAWQSTIGLTRDFYPTLDGSSTPRVFQESKWATWGFTGFGGERVKAALSVILALSEVMKNKLGVQLGFLFLDEPPFLDADGVRAYVEALEAIQRRYADMRIMAITHDEAMKSMFPQSVMVIKDENGSHAALE